MSYSVPFTVTLVINFPSSRYKKKKRRGKGAAVFTAVITDAGIMNVAL